MSSESLDVGYDTPHTVIYYADCRGLKRLPTYTYPSHRIYRIMPALDDGRKCSERTIDTIDAAKQSRHPPDSTKQSGVPIRIRGVEKPLLM